MADNQMQNSPAANLQARQLLLATAFPFVRKLGTFGPFSPGQSTQIQLDRVGIFTHIALDVSASVNITTATTQSDVGPYNLLQNVQYSDFNTVKRVNTSGHLLYALQCVRRRRLSHEAYAAQTVAGLGQVDTNLQFPTALGAGTIAFRLDVPLAYRPDTDLRGAILAQTVVGDHFLNLTFANSAVATDGTQAPYTAGAATISNIYVTVYE
ncbi:MAG: hypothetical protein KGJ13_12065, partial [Patescibacteria group bacterium]|nr:hypothetical protein [Patescibacteria group bacterium]